MKSHVASSHVASKQVVATAMAGSEGARAPAACNAAWWTSSDARKEVDPSRLGIGFAHVLRGVYGVDSLWLEQSKIKLLRDIGSIVADSYDHIKP